MDQSTTTTISRQVGQKQIISPKPKATWQKPQLQQLHVSLDTALSCGSGGDGVGLTSIC